MMKVFFLALCALALHESHGASNINCENARTTSGVSAQQVTDFCTTNVESFENATCTTAVNELATEFATCVDASPLCACYSTLYKSLAEKNCYSDGPAQALMAKLGFRYGVGEPTATKYNGATCEGNPFLDFNGSYTGQGTIFNAQTGCVPACAHACAYEECTADAVARGVSMILAVLVVAAFTF